MRTPRVWVAGAKPGGRFELAADDARHLCRVLRRSVGDPVEVLTGGSDLLAAEIESVDDDAGVPRVTVCIGEPLPTLVPSALPWTVAVAPVKDRDFDTAVRLASELGLRGLIPLITRRTEVRPGRREGGSREARWRRLATESAKQCGRPRPLEIAGARDFGELLESAEASAGHLYIADPERGRGAGPVGAALESGRPALFLIGPEGGFHPAELEAAEAAGAAAIRFPTPVLRTPTAVLLLAALAVRGPDWP